MKRAVVLGGGPAGATAAERLAASGLDTILIDEKLAWEKPCGGGVTFKAYDRYPYLAQNTVSKKIVTSTSLGATESGSIDLNLDRPILIYSRRDLNQLLLDRAASAGVQLEKQHVTGLKAMTQGWSVQTKSSSIDADFLIVATGARNPLRNFGTAYAPADVMNALGYFIPSDREHIDIQFLDRLEGYIWVFPRNGHLSAGICGRGESAAQLRARLEQYLDQHGINWRAGQLYAHVLPSLDKRHWRNNRVAGNRWLAVGDAAGLVDPITGEGIYYAIRSGDLASQVITTAAFDPQKAAVQYRQTLDQDFVQDLEFGASFAQTLFLGRFLFRGIPACIIDYMRRSPLLQELMRDLFSGTQDYLTLRSRLLRTLNSSFGESVFNFILAPART